MLIQDLMMKEKLRPEKTLSSADHPQVIEYGTMYSFSLIA
jgi:hypothetical protein